MTADDIAAQQAFHRDEMDVGDGPWERWLRRLENKLGHSVDGDNTEDAKARFVESGYSLDEASDLFDAGKTPDEAFVLFRQQMAVAVGRLAGISREEFDRLYAIVFADKIKYRDVLDRYIDVSYLHIRTWDAEDAQ